MFGRIRRVFEAPADGPHSRIDPGLGGHRAHLGPPAEISGGAIRKSLHRPQLRPATWRRRRSKGRQATTPSEIPARGWKDILLRVFANISRHRVLALAAGMTYYSILAIFPAIAALVAVYGLFADPTSMTRHLDQLGGFLSGGAIDVAREQLTRCPRRVRIPWASHLRSAWLLRCGAQMRQ
jgi:hypothetical protein